ncbi:E3 SUMO-protein ligase ZBED1-like [Musca autumnalis]|uniref:E3 SUMO-protein ligase ZBED1-like n=1 Tax=Musca autumnalis TaxID=221902 RepID=UPI003CEDE842
MPSFVWLYFEKIDGGLHVKCSICKNVFKYNRNTSTMANHLRAIHKIENKKQDKNDPVETVAKQPEVFAGPLDKSFRSINAFAADGHKQKTMLNALLYMIVKDNMPFQTPHKEGFKYFCKKLQPLYQPPSVTTVVKRLEIKYEELCQKVKREMAQSDYICLTTDLWTHKFTMQSYLGVTAHYLQDINMKTVELGAFPINERKTITNLKALLRQICIQWEIPDAKISAILSDGGSNIKGAIREGFGIYKHVSCFAHAFNNIAQRVIEINVPENLLEDEAAGISNIPEVPSDEENIDDSFELNETPLSPLRDIIKKVKTIVKFFKKSEIATKELEKLQSESGQNALKLVQEVKTRWNSCYEMLDRFILLENQVGRVLMQMHTERNSRSKPPTMLTGAELDAVEYVRNVLKPLYLITKEISAEKYVTISRDGFYRVFTR